MTRPTILVDGHVFDGKPQGSAAYLAGLYAEVARSDLAHVMVACHQKASLGRWFPEDAKVEWVPLVAQGKYQRLAMEMSHIQARLAPDYAHFHYICPLRKTGKWIDTIHDVLFLDYPQHFPLSYRLKNKLLFQISALRSDVILTTSHYSRDAIHRHFGIDLARIHVTPAAPDSFFEADDVAIDAVRPGQFLVYVSRFEPRKNQHALVEAFHDLQSELPDDFRLVLVGYPALPYPALDAALARAGSRVTVLSNLGHAELTWLYRHAAASIYPSLAEGFGMPVIEAVAAGGISYCANNSAMAELVPYVHGSFDSSDAAQLRDIVRRAAVGRDEALRSAIQARTMSAFSWAASASALLEALRP